MFLRDETGFTGSEKAVITLIGVGIVMIISKAILDGSRTGSTAASSEITSQRSASNFLLQ
jgi:Flp pilus assembly pilin Flp